MKGETKFFLGIIIVTVILVIGAAFIFGGSSRKTATTTGPKVSSEILVRDDSYKSASGSAKATLVEFGDYQCPACGTYHPLVKELISEFKGDLVFVFRNFPLSQHQNGRISAQAAEAAGLQGKFWEMHDWIYENQARWSLAGNARDIFTGYAQSLGLNSDQFKKDLDSDKIKSKLERDTADGNSAGVDSTPSFFLNGEKLENPGSLDDFKTLIKAAILKSPITQSPAANYHAHADFKVYINGKPLDFSISKYQSVEGKELDPSVHLHDGIGTVIHIHKQGITLGEFFKSLGFAFDNKCIRTDSGTKYCTDNSSSLKLFVNGKPDVQFDRYVPQDLDRVLVSFGAENEKELQNQLSQVTDTACLYSLKCPERGKPPTENCAGGLGSGCKD